MGGGGGGAGGGGRWVGGSRGGVSQTLHSHAGIGGHTLHIAQLKTVRKFSGFFWRKFKNQTLIFIEGKVRIC